MNGKADRPHIIINALLLDTSATYRGAGISQYSRHLLEALSHIQDGMDVTAVIGDKTWHPPEPIRPYRPQWPVHHPVGRIIWEQTRMPYILKSLKAHLYHGLAFIAPLVTSIPSVVTVHDLSFVHFPNTFPPLKAFYLKWGTRTSVHRAQRVITVSESTRQDLIAWARLSPDKVITVPNGVSSRFRPLPRSVIDTWRARKGLPETFILYVGTLQPRKNVETLLRAYAELTAPPPLILAGAKGWYYHTIFHLVTSLGLERHVLFPGYLPPEELPYWYNAATLFAYPSLFEGFGLSVLEAMACGTPVVVANTSALPEVVADAGLLVPPRDVKAWVRALDTLLHDPDLQYTLRERGISRARSFSWTRTARETLAVYQHIMDGRHGRTAA